MASVRKHGKRITVRLYCEREYSTTIPLKPTVANIRAAEKDAERYEARLKAGVPWQVIRAELRGEEAPTQPKTLEYYMKHVFATKDVERTTLDFYKKTYERVWSEFGAREITSIMRSELEARLAEFDYIPKSKRSALSVVRSAFEIARSDNLAFPQGVLPTDNWKFKRVQRKAKQPYTPEQRDILLKQMKSNIKQSGSIEETAWRFFTLAFYTGLRTEELLALQKQHLRKPMLRVEQVRTAGKVETRTKNHQSREVHVHPDVWDEVVAPWQFRVWLFVGEKGKPLTTQNRLMEQFQLAHKATGIERPANQSGGPMPYPWRNTYASIALRDGVRPQLVANQLGNDLKTMLDYYAEFMAREDDFEELERVFSR